MDPALLRNIGIIAHIDAGKTTLSERILYLTGVEPYLGDVAAGTATLDWMPEERRRGITITSAATTVPWKGYSINLIDTPGHVDFTVEVERCLRVLDGAVLVLSALSGVQAQSEAVFRHARRDGLPTLTFVNQCDRTGADFLGAVADLERRLAVRALPIQYPIGEGPEHRGVVDLVELRAFEFGADLRPREVPLPDAVRDEVGVLRHELLEALAEEDEAVFEALAADREPDVGALRAAVRAATLAGSLHPVLCGSALRGIGIATLLDAVVDTLPSPLARPPLPVTTPDGEAVEPLRPDPDGPLCVLVFKVQAGRPADLAFARVYAGTLREGEPVLDVRSGVVAPVEGLVRVHADDTRRAAAAGPGEIVGLLGARAGTGDTLCSPERPLLVERRPFSEPVLSVVVEPRAEVEREALAAALERLAREDPTLRVRDEPDTGQWVVSGMGELHLEVLGRRLRDEAGLEARFGPPQVAYREGLVAGGRGSSHVERQHGERTLSGAIELELVPDPGSGGLTIAFRGEPPPPALRDAVEAAVRRAAEVGPRFGYPLVDARVELELLSDGRGPDAEFALSQAATIALRGAWGTARVQLEEPWMDLEVETPPEFTGGLLAGLGAAGAEVRELLADAGRQTIAARVPLHGMAGYSTALRSQSQGRASFTLTPSGYRPVPEAELAARGLVWA